MKASLLKDKKIGLWQRKLFYSIVLLCTAMVIPLSAQRQTTEFSKNEVFKGDYTSAGIVDAGNKIYRITIGNMLGGGIGLYTVSTDTLHPITQKGKRQDLLVGGTKDGIGRPGTSYTTIRSYTSGTDYVQTEFARPAPFSRFKVFWLDSSFINEESIAAEKEYLFPIIPGGNNGSQRTGYRVRYALPGRSKARDHMIITQKLQAHGTSFYDSWVEMTTIVKNTGPEAIEIGIRYFWDLNVGGDDGPELFEQVFNTSLGQWEARVDRVEFAYFRADGTDTTKTRLGKQIDFNVYSSAFTPTNLLRVPLQPTRLQQVSWLRSFFDPFDYYPNPNLDVIGRGDPQTDLKQGDSAVQFFWGATREQAIVILPEDSVQVTQALFAANCDTTFLPPRYEPPSIFDGALPVCTITKWQFEPQRRVELFIQDEVSGLRFLQAENLFNAKIEVPDFKIGDVDPKPFVVTAFNDAEPMGFLVRARDLAGNAIECDPVFLTLAPKLKIFEYNVEPLFSDRYFYIKNQGVRWITANINGHEFKLNAEYSKSLKNSRTFQIPLNGDITLDIARYLKPEGNKMHIAYDGPEDSRADLVLSDVLVKSSVDVVLDLAPIPEQFALSQNLPNPFHGVTTIRFNIPSSVTIAGTERVQIRIYNLLGQLVRTLIDADLPTGSYDARWNGRDEDGRLVAAGIYLYNLTAGQMLINKKMALMR